MPKDATNQEVNPQGFEEETRNGKIRGSSDS